MTGGVWGCLGGVWVVSGECLGAAGGVWGGVGWCLGGVLGTFSDPGTLCPPHDIRESRTPCLIGLI